MAQAPATPVRLCSFVAAAAENENLADKLRKTHKQRNRVTPMNATGGVSSSSEAPPLAARVVESEPRKRSRASPSDVEGAAVMVAQGSSGSSASHAVASTQSDEFMWWIRGSESAVADAAEDTAAMLDARNDHELKAVESLASAAVSGERDGVV